MEIEFFGINGQPFRYDLPEFTDEAIEAVRQRVEREMHQVLPLSPRTGFPEFTIYDEQGEEVGGG